MLMLLNAGHACKYRTFNEDFVMILGPGQIIHLDIAGGVILFKAGFHLFWCHERTLSETAAEVHLKCFLCGSKKASLL